MKMRQRFDQLAKQIITGALELSGRVDAEYQIVGPAQAIDIWFRPDPALAGNLAYAGLLGQMAREPCMIEPFRNTPGIAEVQSCISKQHILAHENARSSSDTNDSRPGLPRLWVISTGRPETLLRAYEFVPMADWPQGCYRAQLDISRLFLVVVRELPATRATLLLRLLGRGPTYKEAVEELARLPDGAWEKQLVRPLLVALAFKIPQDGQDDMDAQEYLREARTLYAEWENRIRAEGHEKGHEEGHKEGHKEGRKEGQLLGERTLLRKQLVRRFGELPASVVVRLEQGSFEELELWAERVLAAASLADVFD